MSLIITGVLSAGLIAAAIVLLTGRGSWLIAGFNTMTKEEKEQYDKRALCKFMGKILLPIGMLTPLPVLSGILDMSWLGIVFPLSIFVLVIFAAIYANTGDRFKVNNDGLKVNKEDIT
jgi:ABC-type Na+ efflux pump permease subunit